MVGVGWIDSAVRIAIEIFSRYSNILYSYIFMKKLGLGWVIGKKATKSMGQS